MLVDTHTHLNDEKFDIDRDEVINNAISNGVKIMINVGYNKKTIMETMKLIEEYEGIFGVIGWHPNDASEMESEDIALIEELTHHPKIVGIGEIGLDYYWDTVPKDIQQKVFREQINLAKKVKLPIIIHDREAHQDILDILKEEKAHEVGGIMHSFSGSFEMAMECINMGFYISFSGPVTFKNAKKQKEVASKIPFNKILIETDSPYLTPEPYRGKRNQSAYVKYVAEKIAELRGIDISEVEEITTENAKKILNIE